MVHWHFDERMAVERMRETERQANRAQAVGLFRREGPTARLRLQRTLGDWLIALGQYLQRPGVGANGAR